MIHALSVICEQSLLHLPLVLGAFITISLMKLPDLAIEAAYVFGAIVGARALVALPGMQCASIVACGGAFLGGIMVGIIAASIRLYARCSHLLASIITIGLFHGIQQLVLGSSHLALGESNTLLTLLPLNVHHPELGMLMLIGCMLVFFVWFVLRTQFGIAAAVYGDNEHFFHHYGISGTFIFIAGIALAHAIAGFGGFIMVQSLGMVDITMGFGIPLLCITALMIGSVLVPSSLPICLAKPLVGTVAYFTIQYVLVLFMTRAGSVFDTKYATMCQAIIVLIIVGWRAMRAHRGGSHDSATLGI